MFSLKQSINPDHEGKLQDIHRVKILNGLKKDQFSHYFVPNTYKENNKGSAIAGTALDHIEKALNEQTSSTEERSKIKKDHEIKEYGFKDKTAGYLIPIDNPVAKTIKTAFENQRNKRMKNKQST